MTKRVMRAAVAAAAAVGIGAAGAVTAAPAQAAGVPNLHLDGGVYCNFGVTPGKPWGLSWNMTRWMKVTAQNGDFRNVTLQEFNAGRKFSPLLKSGQSLEIKTVWFGCFPSSISGYTISDYAENLTDNAGFWWNVRKIDNPKPKAAPQAAVK